VSPGLTEQANGTAFLRYFKPVKCFMNSCNNLKDKQAMSFFLFYYFFIYILFSFDTCGRLPTRKSHKPQVYHFKCVFICIFLREFTVSWSWVL